MITCPHCNKEIIAPKRKYKPRKHKPSKAEARNTVAELGSIADAARYYQLTRQTIYNILKEPILDDLV